MNFKNMKPTALALIALMLAACSVTQEKLDIERAANDSNGVARYRTTMQAESATLDAKRAAQIVHRPYITGRAIPVSREVTLPMPLRQGVDTTLLFSDGAVDLVTLAARIQDATGIPVQVTPDALLPAENFLPNLAQNNDARSQQNQSNRYPNTADPSAGTSLEGLMPEGVVTSTPASTPATINPQPQPDITAKKAPATIAQNGKAEKRKPSAAATRPLDATLDSIAMKLFVSWKYNDTSGAIIFYRTETKVFEVRNLEISGGAEMTVGLSGSTDGNSSSNGLDSRSKSILKADRKDLPMTQLLSRVQQFMTRAGKAVTGEDGYLIVTDTKASLDRIDAYIRSENAMRSRRIDLVYQEITVEKNNSIQGGLNWNLAFNTGAGNGGSVSGLSSLIEQEGAAMSLGLSAGSGKFAGSSVAVQALSKIGKIVSERTNVFGSTYGKPATVGRPKRLSYIDKTDQTPSNSDVNGPTISMSTKELVYGRLITFLPYAYSNGDINLTIKYDDTPKPDIEKISQPNGSFVQNPQVESDVYVRNATLRPGQPYVISAETEDSRTSDERRTDPKAPIIAGGSDVTENDQRVTVSVITAMVRE